MRVWRETNVCGCVKDPSSKLPAPSSRQKKGPGTSPRPFLCEGWLERQCSFDLNESGRSVAAQERSKDTGRHTDCVNDRTKSRAGDIAIRLVEVWMVEDIKELQADSEVAGFANRQMEVLHYSQVGVKKVRAPNLIASLDPKAVYRWSELRRAVEARCVKRLARADYRAAREVIRKHIVATVGAVVEAT